VRTTMEGNSWQQDVGDEREVNDADGDETGRDHARLR